MKQMIRYFKEKEKREFIEKISEDFKNRVGNIFKDMNIEDADDAIALLYNVIFNINLQIKNKPKKIEQHFNFLKQEEMKNIFRFPICGGNERTKHPTQKPLGLIMELLKRHSFESDIVFDMFLGSGTSAVAAKELGRRFIGIEIDEKYCEIARRRLSQGVFEF